MRQGGRRICSISSHGATRRAATQDVADALAHPQSRGSNVMDLLAMFVLASPALFLA